MRLSTSSAASYGLLWIVLALSVVGIGGANGQNFHVGREVQLVERQLPDLSNISTCGVSGLLAFLAVDKFTLTNIQSS